MRLQNTTGGEPKPFCHLKEAWWRSLLKCLFQSRVDCGKTRSFPLGDPCRKRGTQLWKLLTERLIDRIAETCGNAIQRRDRLVGENVIFEDLLHVRQFADRLYSTPPPMAQTGRATVQ